MLFKYSSFSGQVGQLPECETNQTEKEKKIAFLFVSDLNIINPGYAVLQLRISRRKPKLKLLSF